MDGIKYSVIIPMYNEQEVIKESYRRLDGVMRPLGEEYELIFVNDGSRDKTMEIMLEIANNDKHVKIVDFARNFGHQTAVTAGMKYSSGDAVVIIDADLQDPPELIPGMLEKWKEGYEVVYGKRLKREGETKFKLFTAKAFYKVINSLSGNMIPMDTGDFRLIDRAVVDAMNAMPEHNRFLRGMGSWVGFRQYAYEYKRDERWAGTTKYPLKKMIKLAKDGIISFSSKPLEMLGFLGCAISGLCFLWLLVLIILAICGVFFMQWQLIVSFMGIFAGIILIGMGILGEYIGRIYDEAKGRPLYTVLRTINFDVQK
ncbi:MAG: glycosyltransferase family 2 protein [Christensenellaceae bacterium]|nr:glycosyltransferase family 2 protein [Christensenellaceae bacterium]PWL99961.1 MAG: glycosyltransferase [Selenomonadales bacterium]